jgi:hypothetical protein
MYRRGLTFIVLMIVAIVLLTQPDPDEVVAKPYRVALSTAGRGNAGPSIVSEGPVAGSGAGMNWVWYVLLGVGGGILGAWLHHISFELGYKRGLRDGKEFREKRHD